MLDLAAIALTTGMGQKDSSGHAWWETTVALLILFGWFILLIAAIVQSTRQGSLSQLIIGIWHPVIYWFLKIFGALKPDLMAKMHF